MSAADPLVGRDAALAVLHGALAAARHGQGRTVLLAGEPGIGKTALAQRVARDAGADGAIVLWGQCWEGDGAPAYWPWVQVLRGAAGDGPGEPARTLPDLVRQVGPGDAESVRFRLFDGVVQAVAGFADDEPVVVVLEDLQWADPPTLLLLEFAVRHLRTAPVLLLGTYRDVEAGDRLLRVAGSGAEVVALQGLPASSVAAVMAAATGREPSSEEAAQVWRRTGGNPFFIRELCRLVEAGGPSTGGRPAAVLVDSIRDTLERRLARLSQRCVDLLAVAAVAGSEIRPELLAQVCRDVAVTDLLEEAAAARVLANPSAPVTAYRFAHDLYRETIITGMTASGQAGLHLRIGRALEAVGRAGADVHPAELAVHFVAAAAEGRPASAETIDAAARYSVLAAEDAATRFAYEDARAHYARALQVLDAGTTGDPAARLALLLGMADAANHAGSSEAHGLYVDAVALARQSADPSGLARAALGLHSFGARSATAHVQHVTLLREAADGLAGEVNSLRARTLAAAARELHHSAVPSLTAQARTLAEDAVAVAREVGDPTTLAFCLLSLHDARWVRGGAGHRLPIIEEMLRVATDAGDLDMEAQARLLRAGALLELGEPAARSELLAYCTVAESLGHARGRWGALSRSATLALVDGRLDEAARHSREALDLGRQIGEPDAAGVYSTQQMSLFAFGHGGPPARESLPDPALLPAVEVLDLQDGDPGASHTTLAGFDVEQLAATHDLEGLTIAAIALAAGGTDHARRHAYDRLAPFAGTHVVVGGCATYLGAVDHHLGALAAARKRCAEAATHFADAAAMYHRLGAPAWAELSSLEQQRVESTAPTTYENIFRRDGAVWILAYEGTSIHLPDAKGLRDLAVLLANPGRPISALELLSGQPLVATGSDVVLDDRARAAYRARLNDLDAEIDEADRHHDPVRAERARTEKDVLVTALAAALGLGRRPRRLGDERERARKAVTARIRDTLARIETQHPALAAHLRDAVSTGASCTYEPAGPTRWAL